MNIKHLGQVFTPDNIVADMLRLRKNFGRTLEPSAGDGAFSKHITDCVSIEIDEQYCENVTHNIDFFDFPIQEKFDTIIGNPPYVRFQDIPQKTKTKLALTLFDERTNLYLFFIEKCIRHLNSGGELIFITPRDFLKATSSVKLNQFIYEQGTITDIIELGDSKIFKGFTPNCVIFRFEKGNYTRKTNVIKNFIFNDGQLSFVSNDYIVPLKDIFSVKVGAVSGADKIFTNDELGNLDFVNSTTAKTGKTRRMVFNQKLPYLEQYKDKLIKRGIRKFTDADWWQWGRSHYISDSERIYVNCRTRNKRPFFIHQCLNYDGSVLALFPKQVGGILLEVAERLNDVDWAELGFVCDGRYIFSQRSLEGVMLPSAFAHLLHHPFK
jgi:adenine-specific DNA-methyltransferase